MPGIYIHIPYCRTLCPYCDFVKVRTKTTVPEAFTDALCSEIDAYDGLVDSQSVFFGGGTPSLVPPAQLERILGALHDQFSFHDPEITLEANPDDVTDELVQAWKDLGINRISMGVQSFDERVLRYLGRRHDVGGAEHACEIIARHFDSWNLDLIFGAKPIGAWEATLQRAVEINPPHIAAYGLTYEPGTPFEKRMDDAVDPDTSLELYKELERILANYDHYEISNFAKPGRASRHNLVYWNNGEYAGFGTGAYSYLDGVRARNHSRLEQYLEVPGEKEEALTLTQAEEKVETMIQYMRLHAGIPRADYETRFGCAIEADYGVALDALVARGLVEYTPTHIRPTTEGFYLNNEIGLELLSAVLPE